MSQNVHAHNFVSDPDLMASFLEALIEGFKSRRLSVKFEEREIVLRPADILDVSLETAKRKGRQRLTITFAWPDASVKERRSLLDPAGPGSEERG
jgi:amphi-Trp domain-containing protein